MLKKLAVVGSVVTVAGRGIGGVASAWSGAPAAQAVLPSQIGAVVAAAAAPTSPTTATGAATGTPATSTPGRSTPGKKHDRKRAGLATRLLRVSHAQWVTKDAKTGTFVTHDAVRGEVTAAATGSITIRATDGTSETFVVTGSTRVRVAGAAGTIAQVKIGDRAAVLGTGSGPMTATRIVDRGAPGIEHTGTEQKPGKAGTSTAPATTAAPTS